MTTRTVRRRQVNAATYAARRRAHEAFDRLWDNKSPIRITRRAAYAWLAQAFGKPEVHMADMTIEECDRVVALVNDHQGRLQRALELASARSKR